MDIYYQWENGGHVRSGMPMVSWGITQNMSEQPETPLLYCNFTRLETHLLAIYLFAQSENPDALPRPGLRCQPVPSQMYRNSMIHPQVQPKTSPDPPYPRTGFCDGHTDTLPIAEAHSHPAYMGRSRWRLKYQNTRERPSTKSSRAYDPRSSRSGLIGDRRLLNLILSSLATKFTRHV
ncbi:hypothetical protein BD779DRAFT_1153759 [Infundibulicybe gibba]|nr:hypothetical protein BD779DRAFT_1153759 [Infundibulicybe gibba]